MKKQQGFSLLEALITMLVLSIGLLGLVALQVTGLKQNQSALYRSHATMQAYQISDRMRANRTVAEAGGYTMAMTVVADAPGGTALADVDRSDWLTNLDNGLPVGAGAISINSGVVTITIQWDDVRAGGQSTQQFTMSTML